MWQLSGRGPLVEHWFSAPINDCLMTGEQQKKVKHRVTPKVRSKLKIFNYIELLIFEAYITISKSVKSKGLRLDTKILGLVATHPPPPPPTKSNSSLTLLFRVYLVLG